jgi:drug/metabolite transporter (DMT)-like permease
MTITLYNFLFAAIGGAFIVDYKQITNGLSSGASTVAMVFACAIIATVIPYLLYTKGLEYIENSKASVIVAIEPVTATVLGMVLYNESLTVISVVGMALVIAAIAMLSGKQPERHKTKRDR